jgi:hypothetical protein
MGEDQQTAHGTASIKGIRIWRGIVQIVPALLSSELLQ